MRRYLVKALLVVARLSAKLSLPTKRIVFLVLVILWVNVINYTLFHHRHKALDYLANKINLLNPLNNYEGHAIPKKLVDSILVKFLLDEAKVRSDERRVELHSQNYDDLFTRHAIEEVIQLSFSDRCDAFFRNLYVSSGSNWMLDAPERFKMDMEYEIPWDDYKNKYEKETREKLAASQKKKPEDVNGDDIHNAIAEVYDGLKDQAKKNERAMLDQIAIGRIFSQCFVTRDVSSVKQKLDRFAANQARLMSKFSHKQLVLSEEERKINKNKFPDCADLETRVYPWLSFQYPVYERYTGEAFEGPPPMSEFVGEEFQSGRGKLRSDQSIKLIFTGGKPCWLNNFKNLLNGKGVVIPFYEGSVDDIKSLIRLLRALKNEYPVQVISYGPIEKDHKHALIDAAQKPLTDLPGSYNDVKDTFEELIVESEEVGLTTQELWFVDALAMLVPEAKEKWDDFPLSILATFASSFEEILLFDPTAIPLKNPGYFFSQREYEQKGAYFYRAKPMHTREDRNINFFNKLLPSLIDLVVFEIPILTAQSLDLPFFTGLQEVQDPGVVVVDKSQHFAAINSLMQLGAFWPASYRGNVSQELWLGFLVSGDESFHFNKYFPAAISDELSEKDGAPQICSAHTGHLDPVTSNELVWLTNGLMTCPAKDADAKADHGNAFKWKTFEKVEDMERYYRSRFKVTMAVVPPFVNTDSFDLKNDDGLPESPWMEGDGCKGMVMCANSEIGGKTKYGSNKQRGQFLEFEALETDLIAFYGDIWLKGRD